MPDGRPSDYAVTMIGFFLTTIMTSMFPLVIAQDAPAPSVQTGEWRAWLESPGGALTFGLRLEHAEGGEGGYRAWLINGAESSAIPSVRHEDGELILEFTHYNSVIRARPNATGRTLRGQWRKVQGRDVWTIMNFGAAIRTAKPEAPAKKRPGRDDPSVSTISESMRIAGRWRIDFASSDDPAVGVFEVLPGLPDDRVQGTILTTTGDYRFLGGAYAERRMELSVFDGAHAFLFTAEVQDDGTLAGDFWSRDAWHETWTAVRDDRAALPDAFGLTAWNKDASLADLKFRDLDGALVSPADERFVGKARIIEVFGTWCPNCNDATAYLKELHERYAPRGLSILSLAFEITGDVERDTSQVKRSIDYHSIEWPILIAGISDKEAASRALPVLDRVLAYPTFIFLDASGGVKAIYTGFSGPATGPAHEKLREDFERIIEGMLGE